MKRRVREPPAPRNMHRGGNADPADYADFLDSSASDFTSIGQRRIRRFDVGGANGDRGDAERTGNPPANSLATAENSLHAEDSQTAKLLRRVCQWRAHRDEGHIGHDNLGRTSVDGYLSDMYGKFNE